MVPVALQKFSLAGQHQREASTLADLKTERAALSAKATQIETEAAPIRYVAEVVASKATASGQSTGNRIDGRGVGTAISHRLNHIGPQDVR